MLFPRSYECVYVQIYSHTHISRGVSMGTDDINPLPESLTEDLHNKGEVF